MGEGFDGDYLLTIGVDFATKDIVKEGEKFKCQIWDLAGQERFKFLQESFLKGCHGILFVFDVSRLESSESVVDWLYEVEKVINEPVPVIVIGNKIDTVPDDQRAFLPTELKVEVWGKKRTFPIFTTSAKTGENVEQVFNQLIDRILGS